MKVKVENGEKRVEIYVEDLKDEAKAELRELLGGGFDNFSLAPLTTFFIEE